MTRKERTALESAITIRKERLDAANEVFGIDSTEFWIVKNELELLENLFTEPLAKPRRKYTRHKPLTRIYAPGESDIKVMYINKDGALFIQLYNKGYSLKNNRVCVRMFDYEVSGVLDRETNSGIVLTQWRIDRK